MQLKADQFCLNLLQQVIIIAVTEQTCRGYVLLLSHARTPISESGLALLHHYFCQHTVSING